MHDVPVAMMIRSEVDVALLDYKLIRSVRTEKLPPVTPVIAKVMATTAVRYGLVSMLTVICDQDSVSIELSCNGSNSLAMPSEDMFRLRVEAVAPCCHLQADQTEGSGNCTVRARFKRTSRGSPVEAGACTRPCIGENVAGDLCLFRQLDDRHLVLLADVLGHGAAAHTGAERIRRWAEEQNEGGVQDCFTKLDRLLSGNRGAALFLATLDETVLEYVMVGNIRAWIMISGKWHALVGRQGIVGRSKGGVPFPHRVPLAETPVFSLVLCSDGIRQGFSPAQATWGWNLPAQRIAEQVVNLHGTPHDDASIMVVKGDYR